MERRKQQVFFPHISGGWKFKVKVTNDSRPGGSLFLGCRRCPDPCVPAPWRERRARLFPVLIQMLLSSHTPSPTSTVTLMFGAATCEFCEDTNIPSTSGSS